jgi:hypothetical protein
MLGNQQDVFFSMYHTLYYCDTVYLLDDLAIIELHREMCEARRRYFSLLFSCLFLDLFVRYVAGVLRSVGPLIYTFCHGCHLRCIRKWYCETNVQNHMAYVISVKRFRFPSFVT